MPHSGPACLLGHVCLAFCLAQDDPEEEMETETSKSEEVPEEEMEVEGTEEMEKASDPGGSDVSLAFLIS